jgi:hypothetical protein
MEPEAYFERKLTMRIGVFRRMGVTFTTDEMLRIREGLASGHCQVCGKDQPLDNLTIDHDHKTGKFRGILCGHCNKVLGFVYDDREILGKISDYLDNTPVLR